MKILRCDRFGRWNDRNRWKHSGGWNEDGDSYGHGHSCRMFPLALVAVLLPLLGGCESEVSPVSALALDSQNTGYRLTAEVVRQDSLDEPAQPAYLSATGRDLPELLQNIENALANELYLSQAQALLISEDVAKENILALVDYLCQKNDIRLSLRVAVVRDGEASALLQTNDEIFALSDMLDHAADTGLLPDMPLYRAAEALHADGTAILPAVRQNEFDQTTPAGTAVFSHSQLSCFLDGEIGGTQVIEDNTVGTETAESKDNSAGQGDGADDNASKDSMSNPDSQTDSDGQSDKEGKEEEKAGSKDHTKESQEDEKAGEDTDE